MATSQKYSDPIGALIYGLPVSWDRRTWLHGKWTSVRPENYWKWVWWYEKHDDSVVLLANAAVFLSPILLMELGVHVGIVIAYAMLAMFIVVRTDQYRIQQEIEAAKEQAKSDAIDEWLRKQSRGHW